MKIQFSLVAISLVLSTNAAFAQLGTDQRSSGAMGEYGSQHNTTDESRNEKSQIYAVRDNWAFDKPWPETGPFQPDTNKTNTTNYQSMVDTEVSTLLLAPGSVPTRDFAGPYDLGFGGPGPVTRFGARWSGGPAPVGTGSVDADITNGYE